jgi:DNA-binding transcriptional LysR family regulator
MSIRLTDIKNFLAVSECKTMSEAARRLEITQPALSESIQRLESDIGDRLFYRARSGISLTPGGRVALAKAQSAVASLAELQVNRTTPEFGPRVVTIGCHATVAAYFLADALARLQKSAVDYKIQLKHDLSRSIQTEIQQGRIDVGVVINPSPSPDLVIRRLAVDTVCVWQAKAGAKDRLFCSLALNQTQSILRKWNQAPVNRVDTDSLELIVRLVSAGLGYGIIPERAVSLHGAPLQKVSGTPQFKDTISLMYRPEFGRSAAERTLLQSISQSFAE